VAHPTKAIEERIAQTNHYIAWAKAEGVNGKGISDESAIVLTHLVKIDSGRDQIKVRYGFAARRRRPVQFTLSYSDKASVSALRSSLSAIIKSIKDGAKSAGLEVPSYK
jgi:hypothetical protein